MVWRSHGVFEHPGKLSAVGEQFVSRMRDVTSPCARCRLLCCGACRAGRVIQAGRVVGGEMTRAGA